MANPKYHHGQTGKLSNLTSDTSGNYADNVGQVLEFRDARPGMADAPNFVTFIAFMSSFSQSFTSNWNTEEVYGRMDPIATFKNTTRTISVAWDLPADNLDAAKDNLVRCNQLVSMTYPSYSAQGGSEGNALAMSKPPLIKLRYANLICDNSGNDGLLGFITSINWNPVIEMGYYHADNNVYPKVLQLSVEFQVIHQDQLGFDDKTDKPFMGGDPATHDLNWPWKK